MRGPTQGRELLVHGAAEDDEEEEGREDRGGDRGEPEEKATYTAVN